MKEDFTIARLTNDDWSCQSDQLRDFHKLILDNSDAYPKINRWLERKVYPELHSPARTAFVGYHDEKPVVSAVVKRGLYTKFCHLRISDKLQDRHIGELFFALMTLEAHGVAEEIHFTLPHSLWDKRKDFFRSFGFEEVSKAGKQYRLFDEELRCSAPFEKVWRSVMDKLPKLVEAFTSAGYSMDPTILLSVKPKYADRILSGGKKVEIRKNFSTKWAGHRIALYASTPLKSLVGEALIERIVSGTPEDIWIQFESQIGCSKEEYDNYVGLNKYVQAVVFSDIRAYPYKMPLAEISTIINEDLRPPQTHCRLNVRTAMGSAVSIAALLHNQLRSRNPLLVP